MTIEPTQTFAFAPAGARAPAPIAPTAALRAPGRILRSEGCACGSTPCDCGTNAGSSPSVTDTVELSEEARRQIEQLRTRDAEVRAHEQAHLAAAGPHARGGPTYDYQRGPDGRQYAVGGEVSIDTAPVEGDPDATIRKMDQVIAAALAPAKPSSQDQAVAAAARAARAQAQAELSATQRDSADGEASDSGDAGKPTPEPALTARPESERSPTTPAASNPAEKRHDARVAAYLSGRKSPDARAPQVDLAA